MPVDRINRKIFEWDYRLANEGHKSWSKEVKSLLSECGLMWLYDKPILTDSKTKDTLSLARKQLMRNYMPIWENSLLNKPKLRSYMLTKTRISTEDYVTARISQKRRSCFASLRMGVYPLKIETGRWRGKPLSERICEQCDANVIECEHHFLLKCKRFENQRQSLFDGIRVKCSEIRIYSSPHWDELNVLFARP